MGLSLITNVSSIQKKQQITCQYPIVFLKIGSKKAKKPLVKNKTKIVKKLFSQEKDDGFVYTEISINIEVTSMRC